MINKLSLSAIVSTTLLFSGSLLAADDVAVKVSCEAAGKQASIAIDRAGAGQVSVGQGADAYSCQTVLDLIEGPPFSENASGMLVLELSKQSCAPSSVERKVHRDVFLHIAEPLQQAPREAMAVIERRIAMFQCRVEKLDMAALHTLATQLAARQQVAGN